MKPARLLAPFLVLVGVQQTPANCRAVVAKAALRVVVKDLKTPYSHLSKKGFLTSTENRRWKESLIQPVLHRALKGVIDPSVDISLIDGPLAHFTGKWGIQKQLTIPARILLFSILAPSINSALFPGTVLDRNYWRNKMKEAQNYVGRELNSAELEVYLRYHPAYLDLHKKFLEATKKDSSARIQPYLEKVSQRMKQRLVIEDQLSNLLVPTKEQDYDVVQALVEKYKGNSNADAEAKEIEKLTPAQKAIVARRLFAENALELSDDEDEVVLHPLKSPMEALFGIVTEHHLRVRQMDVAITERLENYLNNYWKADIMISHMRETLYMQLGPGMHSAMEKFNREEAPAMAEFDSIKAKISHPFYFQQTLQAYLAGADQIELYQTLGVTSDNPALKSRTDLLTALKRDLIEQKKLD